MSAGRTGSGKRPTPNAQRPTPNVQAQTDAEISAEVHGGGEPIRGPLFKVRLECVDEDTEEFPVLELPFVPFEGLQLRVPFWELQYAAIDEVYWYDEERLFVAFFDLPDNWKGIFKRRKKKGVWR